MLNSWGPLGYRTQEEDEERRERERDKKVGVNNSTCTFDFVVSADAASSLYLASLALVSPWTLSLRDYFPLWL